MNFVFTAAHEGKNYDQQDEKSTIYKNLLYPTKVFPEEIIKGLVLGTRCFYVKTFQYFLHEIYGIKFE
jgi:hypothetical protein